MTITIKNVEGNELHLEYQGQHGRQPCRVCLDCERRELYAEADPIIGSGMPMRMWHGHVQHWRIPCLKGDAANRLLQSLAEEAAVVCDGYSSVWDGHNHVADFSDSAKSALEGITVTCEAAHDVSDHDMVSIWKAEDWYQPIDPARELGITALTTDAQLDELAESEERSASCDGHDVEGIRKFLGKVRDELMDE